MAVIKFKEQNRQVQIYDFLIFVCGEEISDYAKSIEVTRCDRGGIGSASIVLANPFDQWVITESNLSGYWRKVKDRYSELPKFNIFNRKQALSKKQQLPKSTTDSGGAQGSSGTASNTTDPTLLDLKQNSASQKDIGVENVVNQDFLQRYAFGPGGLIFSKLDTVKVYIRNPYEDPDTTDEWLPFFTGTVDAKPFTTNYVTGDSQVTLSCFDIKSALQGMRIAVNPYKNGLLSADQTPADASGTSASDSNVLVFGANAGYFKDYISPNTTKAPNPFSNIFAGKTFVDSVSLIITGKTGWVNQVNENPVTDGEGVGSFTKGEVYRYHNPGALDSMKSSLPNSITDLSEWDLLCIFGTKRKYWTYRDCLKEGADSFYDGGSHPFVGKLHWLLPSEKLQIANLIISSFEGVNDMMGSPDWTDRYSILVQMCNQVDYQFQVTPCGDIVFEFPMYDFSPKNFSQHPGVYTADMHTKDDMISDEGGEVISGLQTSSLSTIFGQRGQEAAIANAPLQTNIPGDLRAIVFSNVLASKYGVKIQTVSFNGIQSPDALLRISIVEFQKRLAEANKLSTNLTFRPYLLPNRPILCAEPNRLRLGKTTTVSFSMPVLQEPTMSLSLGCVRLPLRKGNETVFQHITGGESFALSYNQIIESPDVGITATFVGTPKNKTPSGGTI